MFESLFDLPLLLVGPAIIGALCLFALLGLLSVRHRVQADSEFNGAISQSIMVQLWEQERSHR